MIAPNSRISVRLRAGASPWERLRSGVVGIEDAFAPVRDVMEESRSLRLKVLNTSLLFAVVVGGFAFARTLVDALDLGDTRVVGLSIVLYGGFIALLLARRLSYTARAIGFLVLLYVVGVISLLTVGYLAAPTIILAGQSVMASVFFDRRITLLTVLINVLTFLGVGAVLSTGVVTAETHFYEPAVFANWLRVGALFTVFAGIAVISVDVITTHLNRSLQDQAELIEHLKGAMQLHEEAEAQRRAAESRLRETGQHELPETTSSGN